MYLNMDQTVTEVGLTVVKPHTTSPQQSVEIGGGCHWNWKKELLRQWEN